MLKLSTEDLATLRDIRNDLQREGECMGMAFVQRGLAVLDKILEAELGTVCETKRCRVYDTFCINPSYCDARDACCAGDPDCRKEVSWKEVP